MKCLWFISWKFQFLSNYFAVINPRMQVILSNYKPRDEKNWTQSSTTRSISLLVNIRTLRYSVFPRYLYSTYKLPVCLWYWSCKLWTEPTFFILTSFACLRGWVSRWLQQKFLILTSRSESFLKYWGFHL